MLDALAVLERSGGGVVIWLKAEEVEHFPREWRCPNPSCGERADRVGIPQWIIQLPGCRGGEFPAVDCTRGHRTVLGRASA